MSAVTLELDPKLYRQAENILKSIGLEYSAALNLINRQIVLRNALPIELRGEEFRPPIPCIDDMTDEEFIRLFEEGMESIEAGRCHTLDEAKKILGVA